MCSSDLVNKACETDPATLESARQELVKLQSGDEENTKIWQSMIAVSQQQFDAIYSRLNVRFDHTLGESFYNPFLKETVQSLVDAGVARESQGAIAVFSDGKLPPKEDPFLVQKDGEWVAFPALIQKKDGVLNYEIGRAHV